MRQHRSADIDPTFAHARISPIERLLSVATAREVEVILLRIVIGLPLDEVARRVRCSTTEAVHLLNLGTSKIRHPSRGNEGLDEFLDAFASPSAEVRDYIAMISLESVTCARCRLPSFPDPTNYASASGRPRKYCSNSCRQAAYRARKRESSLDTTSEPNLKSR
jgi:hypothetical protein